jgi:hypothetical protein
MTWSGQKPSSAHRREQKPGRKQVSSRAKYVFWKRQRATEPGFLLDKKKIVNCPVFDPALRRDTQY